MKKILLIVAVCLLTFSVYSQKRLGIRAGVNLARQHTENEMYDIKDMRNKFGITSNLILRIPVFSFMLFQPEIGYSQKGAKYVGNMYSIQTNLDYVELQTNLIFKSPIFPMYIIGGPYASYCLSASAIQNSTPAFVVEIDSENILFYDAGFSAGLGITREIGPIRTYVEARYNYGLLDVNNKINTENLNIVNKNRGFALFLGLLYNI